MTKSEYADLTYFMIYRYKLVKNSEVISPSKTAMLRINESKTKNSFFFLPSASNFAVEDGIIKKYLSNSGRILKKVVPLRPHR